MVDIQDDSKTRTELLKENIELKTRLNEAEDTLNAIQNGEVDAIITPQGSDGPQVYTLESSDTLYRHLVQEMGEGLATLMLDGTIFYSNAQLASLIHVPLDKIIGIKLKDFILPEDLETYQKIFNNGLKSRSMGEIRIKSDNGTVIPVHISVNHIMNLKGVYIVITDLSEEKHYEELKIDHKELNERENKFRTLFENSIDAILLTIPDGTILSANPAAEKMFGYNEADLLKLGRSDLLETKDPNFLVFLKNIEHDETVKTELIGIKKDGGKFPTEVSANIFQDGHGHKRSSMVIRNITERKLIEAALKKSERRLAEAQHIANIGNWEWNIQTGELTWSNEMYAIHGSDPDCFTPTIGAFTNFIHPDESEYVQTKIQELFYQGKSYDIDYQIVLSDGSIRVLNALAEVAEFDENGKPSLVVGINQDITERKEIELKLNETITNLARSNHELEQFAYVASHDLREPLRMITNFLQLLERRYKDKLDQDANDFIGYAVTGAKRLDTMIKDLLEYSKVTRKQLISVPVNMESVLDETLINMQLPIDETKAVITHDPLPTIYGDSELLVQLLQNFISNSIKYSGKKIPKIHISAKKEYHQYLFSITDNGIGMSPNHLDRIFTIFQRLHTHEEYEGTGIGLSIAQKIVYQHGGEIWVESEPEKGSTFYFTIPHIK